MSASLPPDRRDTVRAAALLAAALVLAAWLVAGALGQLRAGAEEVSVTGSARRAVKADLVVWHLAVTGMRPTLAEALADAKAQGEQVRAFLRAQHVPDSAVTVSPVATSRVNEVRDGNETGRTAAYRVTQKFTVTTQDLATVSQAAARTGDLVTRGVPVDAEPPEYLVRALPELRVALLADAVRDARARAAQIATAADAALGHVKSVRVGVFQVRRPNSTQVSDYGDYDTATPDKDVTVTVHVTFALK